MASPTSPEETLKYFLFRVMSEEDANRFMSLKEVLAACEEEELRWQAIYAFSTHLHVLASYKTSIEFGEFADYIDKYVPGFNGLFRILALVRSEERHQADDHERHIFNEYLISSAKVLMSLLNKLHKHELEYTPWWFLYDLYRGEWVAFFRAVGIFEEGPGDSDTYKETISDDIDPEQYLFVGYAKLMAANTLMPILLKQSDYEAAIEAMTKVAECLPIEDIFLKLDELVNQWLNLLSEGEYEWVGLIDRISTIAEIARNMPDESIDRCIEAKSLAVAYKYSEDFWAWKFGYVVGLLAIAVQPVLKKGEIPLRGVWGHGEVVRGDWDNGLVVLSLLFSSDSTANYFPMWLPADGHQYLTEVGPTNGLYWAMRIGFADARWAKAVTVVPQTSPFQEIEKIENIVTSSALRQLKDNIETKRLLQTVIGRLPPSPEEIENYLLEMLDDTFDRLPLQVIDHLKQAELDFKSGTRKSNAMVEFVKSVEAALDCLFISPLRSYYKQHKLGWPFMVPSADGIKHEYGIRKWGEELCKLAQPAFQQLGNVNQPGIRRFLKDHYPNLDYCELEGFGKSLQDVQKLRGGSAHYQSQFPLNKEIQQLKELREMVLGLERHTSIIKQMVELFGNKKDNI